MSAVIQNEYTGNGSTTTYSFTFPYLKTSDIKASLDGVDTTAFTLPNATTLQFNTAPTNGAKIKIFRQTSVDNLTATFYAGSAIKSEDLNDNFTQNLYKTQEIGGRFISALGGTMTGNFNLGEDADITFEGASDNANETTITVADPTADRTITFPDVTGTVVTTGDTGTVATGMIANDAVTNAKIADDQIDSEHYVDGSIDTQHIANAQVTTAKIADSNVTTGKLADDAVTAAKLADNAVVTANIVDANVTTAKLAADAVNGTKIADNSIDSEHYVDGSIDAAHLASNSVTNAKMADDSVGTAELQDSSVDTARLADNSVTLAKMTDNSVGTSEIVDAAVTTAKIADDAVTTAKIADNTITSALLQADSVVSGKIADSAVSTARIQDGAVSTAKMASSAVTTAILANDAVTTVKIANDAITSAKIADDAVGSTELGDGVIDTVHVGAAQITDAKLASNSVTTTKITDANVTTAKIANDAVTIGKIGCEQTTISDSDSHIPTSGAVVDYVAAQIAPLGGLEVIATEVAFPNTQPSSGVVISISDAGGVVVNGSGTSTTGRTVGGSTVTINGFPASLQSKTMAADIGLMVSSTGSGQVYNYHKILAKEADVEQLSNDINDFAARYRVGSSNPTSSLDNGDLFFNTGTGKMLVYNGTNTAWEEVQSIGNFFISTLSPAFDGSTQNFTLTNAPTNVQQVLLSINGVVQKPNAGSSTPSEGFALDGSTIKLASAPASGTDYFAVVMGSTVNIGTPSNNTVSTAILQDDSVTAAKIAAGAVGATELGANAVITSKIADDAVTSAKIADGAVLASHVALAAINESKLHISNSPTNGYFLSAQSGNAGGLTWAAVNTDLSNDSSPQLGGDLDSNGNDILLGDNCEIKLGAGGDLKLEHQSSSNHSYITEVGGGNLYIQASNLILRDAGTLEHFLDGTQNGTVNIYYDGTKRIETMVEGAKVKRHSGGATTLYIEGAENSSAILDMFADDGDDNADKFRLQTATDGSFSMKNYASGSWETNIRTVGNGAVELYHDNIKTFETISGGAKLLGGEAGSAHLYVFADEGDDNADKWVFRADASSSQLKLRNFASGSWEESIIANGNGSVQLYHDNNLRFATQSYGIALNDLMIQDLNGINSGGNQFRMLVPTGTSGGFRILGHYQDGTLAFNGEVANFYDTQIQFKTDFQSRRITPEADNSYDLGTSSLRWRNIYTNDLHLSNRGHSNDVDSTWGDWTIQEGESDLFLKNNRSGKKYKFNLTEVS